MYFSPSAIRFLQSFFRLYNIENSEAVSLGAFAIGRQPQGFIGGTKSSFLEALGDTAVDFDFAPAEIDDDNIVITETAIMTRTLNDSMGNSERSGLIFIKSRSSTIAEGKFVFVAVDYWKIIGFCSC